MNIYQKIYLEDIITEQNIKSLIPVIQADILKTEIGVDNYQDLLPNDKLLFQQKLNKILQHIKERVNSLTNNLQYQSWVYKILKQQDKEIDEDYNVIKSALIDFKNLCKRPDLKPAQRNINNYPTFQDLQQFILSFQKQHKLQQTLYSNLEQLYQNSKYTCYLIDNYQECHKLFGGEKYFNTGWCVAKSKHYFDTYIENYYNDITKQHGGYIVFIENTTNKPYALLHYDSFQFKDTSDAPIINHSSEIIDCLFNLEPNFYAYNNYETGQSSDLKNFAFDIYHKKYPNNSFFQYLMTILNFDIDEQNKIIDCKDTLLSVSKEMLENDIFSYKIINCKSMELDITIEFLPDNFYIPQSIIHCDGMFYNCRKLKELPENFIIPNNVISCTEMFANCESLIKLPDNFKLPTNVINCAEMFKNCKNLTKLPDNFYISESVNDCQFMFFRSGLTQIPENFDILSKKCNCIQMFANTNIQSIPQKLLNTLRHQFNNDDEYIAIKIFSKPINFLKK